MFHQNNACGRIIGLESTQHPKIPAEMEASGTTFPHQHLPDLTLIHEKFVDLWFKYINYFNAHCGQLPAEILKFIDGLSFAECCFLQNEMNLMSEVVAQYSEHALHQPRDFYTIGYDMNAQVSAYMNYIDQRLGNLHQVEGLVVQPCPTGDFSISFNAEFAG